MTMTYNTLILQIQSYLNNLSPDLIAQIPNFVTQAQQRICRESKNIGLEQYVTSDFVVNNPVIPKPGRWRRTITFNYGTGVGFNTRTQLYLRSYEYCRSYWQNPTLNAPPMYYSDYAYDHILVSPTPDQAYPFELAYLELPEPLSLAVQTNFLTNYAPDVLLYASLLEAVPFLKNDERIGVWKDYYQRGIDSLNNQDDQRILDRTSNRSSD